MLLDFLVNYFGPAVFFQAILIATFLFTHKKGSRKQNWLLALLMLSFGIMIGSRFIFFNPELEKYNAISVAGLDFRFFIGPLFYLYLKSIFKPSVKLKWIDFLHSSVFIFILINQFISKNFWIQPWKIFIVVDMIQIFVYILWSFIEFKLLYLFTKPDYFKYEKRFIFWLQFFVISNIVTLLILIFAWLLVMKVFVLANWNYWIGRLTAISNFVFINSIVYIALKIPDFFIAVKYKNGDLPEMLLQKYKMRLIRHMENKKPYLNPNLSLNILANELSISPKHLSQVLNNSFQQNFYRYVNSFRIEECLKKLKAPSQKKINILEIAYEAGFNSKNTFNSAFKEITGMTPTEFRRQNQQDKKITS